MPARRGPFQVEPFVEAGDWSDIPATSILDDVAAVLGSRLPGARGNAVVALANDAFIHDLNYRFRKVDRPTNVLSFPAGEAPGVGVHLGDVVVAVETLRREAAVQGKPLSHHFTHLSLHGLLHLLGYDHESEGDAARMEGLETEILMELGIPDPYGHEAAAPSNI